MTSEPDDRLHRALNYPYAWPGQCYLFRGGEAHYLDARAQRRQDRSPVLAYGSNRSPEQLRRKFGELCDTHAIPVELCRVTGFDVVHSAHVTSYGAVPAALHSAPGVTVTVAVTWLTDPQLSVMDASEGAGLNYGRAAVGGPVDLVDGTVVHHAETYRTSHGPLRLGGAVVGHADVDAEGRRGPALRNADVLRRAHQRFAPDTTLEAFLLRLGADRAYRQEITRRLQTEL